MSTSSESAPLTRAQELAKLHERFRLPLLAYFARRVRSVSEAQDLVQDVFERVARTIGTQAIRNPDALIFRIAVNLLRDRARRARRRGVEVPLPSEEMTEIADALIVDLSPERVVLGELSLSEVLQALSDLDERTRAMFYLCRLENLKIKEIGNLYGISESAVEKHVAKALAHLSRRIYGDD